MGWHPLVDRVGPRTTLPDKAEKAYLPSCVRDYGEEPWTTGTVEKPRASDEAVAVGYVRGTPTEVSFQWVPET